MSNIMIEEDFLNLILNHVSFAWDTLNPSIIIIQMKKLLYYIK